MDRLFKTDIGMRDEVPNATLETNGDVIIISDGESTVKLDKKAAIELLKRLPKLIIDL